ncbi:MAG: PaaI family thioesterase [Desulfuromonadales bacterium]|nr:PaaI family thioesterase [Desulfuromonadales bacterium]
MQHNIIQSQFISKNCLVCGVDNAFGLKTRFFETANGELVAVFSTMKEHQSYPGMTHGGISATILDETIGRAIMLTCPQTFGVTLELTVRYRKPVPLGEELKAVGRIVSDNGRIFEGSGELYLPDGEVAATATGKYMKRRLDQITDAEFTSRQWFADPQPVPEQITIRE